MPKTAVFFVLMMAFFVVLNPVFARETAWAAGKEGTTRDLFSEPILSGLYVNHRLGVAVFFPANWQSVKPGVCELFRAQGQAGNPSFRLFFYPNFSFPVQELSRLWRAGIEKYSSGEVVLLYDRAVVTAAGIPGQEAEFAWVLNEKNRPSGTKMNSYFLAVKNKRGWFVVGVYSRDGKIRDELKAMIYDMQLTPLESPPYTKGVIMQRTDRQATYLRTGTRPPEW